MNSIAPVTGVSASHVPAVAPGVPSASLDTSPTRSQPFPSPPSAPEPSLDPAPTPSPPPSGSPARSSLPLKSPNDPGTSISPLSPGLSAPSPSSSLASLVPDTPILAYPDGPLTSPSDVLDYSLSRLGGQVLFPSHLPRAPSDSFRVCSSCHEPMPLLVHLFCPFDTSDMDRIVYLFGCPRAKCRHRPGTVKCLRISVPQPTGDPLAQAVWPAVGNAYPAFYLNTVYEGDVGAESDLEEGSEGNNDAQGQDQVTAQGKGKKAPSHPLPQPTNILRDDEAAELEETNTVDPVFMAFQLSAEKFPTQVIRHHPNASPLPFSSRSLPFRALFTYDGEDAVYNSGKIAACSRCGAKFAFELQLMPHLVSVLNRVGAEAGKAKLDSDDKADSSDTAISGENTTPQDLLTRDGLDFATVWLYSCVKECAAYSEEVLFVEWDE